MNPILVTYASKHGATQEIAEAIALVLREGGHPVDVQPVEAVRDVTPYAGVVVGSAIYTGNWRKEAADFLAQQAGALATRPVWLFSSGPTGEGEAAALMQGWTFPETLRPLADRIAPRDIAFFHGRIDPDSLNLVERLAVKAVKAPLGDYRDWEAIREWAAGIAQTLAPA